MRKFHKGSPIFSLADAQAHAARYGYRLEVEGLGMTAENRPEAVTSPTDCRKLPKPVRMTRPEREMGMMLESKKRAGVIVDYRFQGMSLAYSPDPETGIQLRYKCDFVVIRTVPQFAKAAFIKIIECKGYGKHAISAAAKLRFKGAKAAWPWFQFEMWQRERDGNWRRVL